MDDDGTLKKRLDKAECDLVGGHHNVEQQRALIERLCATGHETSSAEALLKTLEHSLQAMEHHRNVILEELGLYKMGESKGSGA